MCTEVEISVDGLYVMIPWSDLSMAAWSSHFGEWQECARLSIMFWFLGAGLSLVNGSLWPGYFRTDTRSLNYDEIIHITMPFL